MTVPGKMQGLFLLFGVLNIVCLLTKLLMIGVNNSRHLFMTSSQATGFVSILI